MGSCVSVHKDDPDSAMKLRLSFRSRTDKLVNPSPIQEKPVFEYEHPISQAGLKSSWSPSHPHPVTTFHDFGSREESFFDSQPWLESDCEDDYFSVNGDLTPSRGSTPVHQSFTTEAPRVNGSLLKDTICGSKPEQSQKEKKKKLSELFQEPLIGNQVHDDPNILGYENGANAKTEAKPTLVDLTQRSSNGTPYVSGANSVCSSERTPDGALRSQKQKSIRSAQCCIPRLLSSRSFSEKRKNSSPAPHIG